MSHPPKAPGWLRLYWLLPVLMLAANALAWLRYGTDFPFFDDWRAYAAGNIGSFSPDRLFQVVNNTMSPVGFALDTLAQRWLDGNVVAYQLLSMLTVLGGLLWLQWRLLGWAVGQGAVRGLAYVFTIFMLQTGTYWGEQSLAYHQALPPLFLLAALCVIWVGRPGLGAMFVVVAALGLLAGLSYISGAVAATVMGVALLLMTWLGGKDPALQVRGRWGGVALALAGSLTTAWQYRATRMVPSDDPARHFPLRWPWDADFWVFMLGKLGRSLGPGFANLHAELLLAAVLALLACGVFVALLWRFVRGRGGSAERLAYVCVPLALMVLAYLGLVSLGRAGLRDASIQHPLDVFQFAYQRFHFFWATLLLPWLVAGLAAAWGRDDPHASARTLGSGAVVAAAALLVALPLAAVRGVFDVGTYYERGMQERAVAIRCLNEQLDAGGPIMCPEFALPGWTDWTPAYQHARAIGASFVKYFPLTAQQRPDPDWLLQWPAQPDAAVVRWVDAEMLADGWRQGVADPQLVIEGADAAAYARCRTLELRLRLRSAQASMAQVFYQLPDSSEFSELMSRARPVPASIDADVELSFMIDSRRGFAPMLRVDPVQGDARFRIEELRVACHLSAP